MQSTIDRDEWSYVGMDKSEHVSLGELVSTPDTRCERCGELMTRGTRTYLIGKHVGGVDCCCEYCARADGADADLLDFRPDLSETTERLTQPE